MDAENDAGILDLVSRDLYPAAPITGSSAANPAVQEYSPQGTEQTWHIEPLLV